jgi:hypothetical protein
MAGGREKRGGAMRHSPCLCLARNIPLGWRGPRCGPLSIFCTQTSTSDVGLIVVKQSSAATTVCLIFGDDQVNCSPMIEIEVQSSYDRYENTMIRKERFAPYLT